VNAAVLSAMGSDSHDLVKADPRFANQTVTLPDGTEQTVLVPQVYAKVKQGDLTRDGALIGGGSVALNARNRQHQQQEAASSRP